MTRKKTVETTEKRAVLKLSRFYKQAFTEWLRAMGYAPKYVITVHAPGVIADRAFLDRAAGIVMGRDPISEDCTIAVTGAVVFSIKGSRGIELNAKIQPITVLLDKDGVLRWSPNAAVYIFATNITQGNPGMDADGNTWVECRVIGESPRRTVSCKYVSPAPGVNGKED